METFVDSALFIKENGKPIAIKWLDQQEHTVIMFKLESVGIEEEKEMLEKCIGYQKPE